MLNLDLALSLHHVISCVLSALTQTAHMEILQSFTYSEGEPDTFRCSTHEAHDLFRGTTSLNLYPALSA